MAEPERAVSPSMECQFPRRIVASEEIEIAGRTWLLPRSQTGELMEGRTAQTAPPLTRSCRTTPLRCFHRLGATENCAGK
jgi:hypothetical protein